MSFFKKLFGKSEDKPVARDLNHANKLILGDIIEFSDSFSLPTDIRQQKFEVIGIETFEFEHQHYPRFKLQGNMKGYVWLSLPGHDNNTLHLSVEINREQVSALFDLDQFSDIFEEGFTQIDSLQPVNLGDWHAASYIQQDQGSVAYHHRSDLRHGKPSQYDDENAGQQFEFYHLQDDQKQRLVDILVRENGETDVYLTMQLNNDSITAYWPVS